MMVVARLFDQTSPDAGYAHIDAAAVVVVRRIVLPDHTMVGVEVCAVSIPGAETLWLHDENRVVSNAILQQRRNRCQ